MSIDINGTAPTRPDYTDNDRSIKAFEIVKRCKQIEKSRPFLYWISHKKRDMALSKIRYRAVDCENCLATGSAFSENKDRLDKDKKFVDTFN
jgi:hypothetical protein